MQLQVKALAVLKDTGGLALDTTAAIADDTTLTVNPDATAPTPNPMTWASAPMATSQTSITMTATTATDGSGVEYFFECTGGGGNSSHLAEQCHLHRYLPVPQCPYTYRVQARDKSPAQTPTGFSTTASATTLLHHRIPWRGSLCPQRPEFAAQRFGHDPAEPCRSLHLDRQLRQLP